jgi:hypothetical protein
MSSALLSPCDHTPRGCDAVICAGITEIIEGGIRKMLRMGRAAAPIIALSGLLLGTVTGTANAADQANPMGAFHVKVTHATRTSLQMEFALPA